MISNILEMLSGLVFDLLGGFIDLLPDSSLSFDNVNSLWASVPGASTIAGWVSYLFPTGYIGAALTAWVAAVLIFVAARSVFKASRK